MWIMWCKLQNNQHMTSCTGKTAWQQQLTCLSGWFASHRPECCCPYLQVRFRCKCSEQGICGAEAKLIAELSRQSRMHAWSYMYSQWRQGVKPLPFNPTKWWAVQCLLLKEAKYSLHLWRCQGSCVCTMPTWCHTCIHDHSSSLLGNMVACMLLIFWYNPIPINVTLKG